MTDAPARDISSCKFVLATDLDGTFLGGSDEDRKQLYDWIEENRQTIGLIFVTGRDPGFIAELCEGGVPWPEFVVGDVGTTIAKVDGKDLSPIASLEEDIAELWGDGGEKVRAALDGVAGLTLQPTEFRYRVSYDMDPDTFDKSVIETVEEMGHDWIASDGKYFDVLPKGISKGPSIKKLVSHLGVSPNTVLCAGDTLNDLSMLECGLPAVAVGGSEASLVERVEPLHHVYIAKGVGAAGILEAVKELNLHETPEEGATQTEE
ncbi:HAD-IIB family hydrolase [Palleronia abyssalis]|uniref:Mannosylfructose-phosphate phosphatase n=1 Tax=Palleronia abyssalis TaxID=1501240 RepID=A0A2R8BXS8_9RHOB|nr:HAD-IIB family hydrolase [Palleronia abyssalis]SPJ24876.1 Mannosylfructose-phosphate phosphatase [Palleronia abyssalis]